MKSRYWTDSLNGLGSRGGIGDLNTAVSSFCFSLRQWSGSRGMNLFYSSDGLGFPLISGGILVGSCN